MKKYHFGGETLCTYYASTAPWMSSLLCSSQMVLVTISLQHCLILVLPESWLEQMFEIHVMHTNPAVLSPPSDLHVHTPLGRSPLYELCG